jgi:RluA family pseudouridine synthase
MEHKNDYSRRIAIRREDAGKELRAYLSARFTYQSESEWAQHIAQGRVSLNGEPCRETVILREKDLVSFTPEPYDEPPVNARFEILAEDEHYLFVNKPPLLPCHPGGIYLFNTLWALLRDRCPDPKFVNRLDRETSGIVIVAKTVEAAAFANARMQERAIAKEYLALVEGSFPSALDAEGFLVPDASSPVRKKLAFTPADSGREFPPGGIACRTELSYRGEFAPGISLVHARLHTGRTHQIRATLQSVGFPVVGDKLYGKDSGIFLRFIDGSLTDSDRANLRLDHQALHCARIAMPGPDGTAYDIAAPEPESWNALAR